MYLDFKIYNDLNKLFLDYNMQKETLYQLLKNDSNRTLQLNIYH